MWTYVAKRGIAALLSVSALTVTNTPVQAGAPVPPFTQSSATIYRLHHDGDIYTSVVLTPLLAGCSQECFYALSVLSSKMAWTTYACQGVFGGGQGTMEGTWQVHQTGVYTYQIQAGRLGGPLGCEDVTYALNTHLGTIHPLR